MAKTKKAMKQEITRRIDSTIAAAVNAIRDLESPSDISMVRERTIKALYGIMDGIKSYKLKETDVPICHTIYSVNRMFDEFETASKCRAIVVAEKKEISDKIEELLVEYNTSLAAVPTRNDFDEDHELFTSIKISKFAEHVIAKIKDNHVVGFVELDEHNEIVRGTEAEIFMWSTVSDIKLNFDNFTVIKQDGVTILVNSKKYDIANIIRNQSYIPDMPSSYKKLHVNNGDVYLDEKTEKLIGATDALALSGYHAYAANENRGYSCIEPVINYVSNANYRFIDRKDFISFETWNQAIDASKKLEAIKMNLDDLYRKRESYEQICDIHENNN